METQINYTDDVVRTFEDAGYLSQRDNLTVLHKNVNDFIDYTVEIISIDDNFVYMSFTIAMENFHNAMKIEQTSINIETEISHNIIYSLEKFLHDKLFHLNGIPPFK